jgi:hypothetical protein
MLVCVCVSRSDELDIRRGLVLSAVLLCVYTLTSFALLCYVQPCAHVGSPLIHELSL